MTMHFSSRFPRRFSAPCQVLHVTFERRRLLSSAPSSLSNWHRVVSQVPLHKILPLGFGGSTDYANVAAYYGDKRIGYEVAMELEKLCAATNSNSSATTKKSKSATTPQPSPAWLTSISQQAISNKLFSEKLSEILPLQSQKVPADLVQLQVHDGGTMVEAAVDAVAKLDGNMIKTSQEASPQQTALSELAQYLIQTTLARGPVNSKGRLLEAGGTVKAEANMDSQKEPWFWAVAHLEGKTSHAEGRSKREAEQAAAAKVLQLTSTTTEGTNTEDEQNTGFAAFSTTERVNFLGQVDDFREGTSKEEKEEHDKDNNLFWEATLNKASAAMNLLNGESPQEWWWRGATRPGRAHHRAMMAPFVFPDQVTAVQCWIRRPQIQGSPAQVSTPSGAEDNGCTVLMVVIGHALPDSNYSKADDEDKPQPPLISSFVEHGPSKSRAVKLAGMAVNHFIATKILRCQDSPSQDGADLSE